MIIRGQRESNPGHLVAFSATLGPTIVQTGYCYSCAPGRQAYTNSATSPIMGTVSGSNLIWLIEFEDFSVESETFLCQKIA